MKQRSLRRNFVLLTTGATAVGVLVLTLLTQWLLEGYTNSTIDDALHAQASGVVSQITVSADGRLEVSPKAVESGTAVYDARGTLVGGVPPGSLLDVFTELSTADRARTMGHGEQARLFARPFSIGENGGVVVTSVAIAPYEHAERLALLISVLAGLLLIGAAAAVASTVSRRSLAPVEDMAEAAHRWSEHDLGQRFPLADPPNELTTLGATLNHLLDRVARAIRSEQRLTSELAHELRTPLTAIRGSADLLLMREELDAEDREGVEAIREASIRMTDTINGLIALARDKPGELGEESELVPVAEVVDTVVTALSGGERVTSSIQAGPGVRGPRTLAERALSPVLANALRMGTHVEVTARAGDGYVDVCVTDDGPGVPEELRSRIFEPGVTSGEGSGAGLGLPLARRLARSVGGDVLLDQAAGPTRFVVRLPA